MQTYFIASSDAVKIGKAENSAKRLKQIQANSPVQLKLLLVIKGDCEKDYHRHFKKYRRCGSEWFELSLEILTFINQCQGSEKSNLSLPIVEAVWGGGVAAIA